MKEKLKSEIKISMKSGDTIKRDILRLALSEITAEEGRENSKNDETAIVKSMVKNLSSIPEDLKTDNARREIEILKSYLPELMSEEEVEIIIDKVIIDTGATTMRDMGKVMGVLSNKYKGKIDNKFASSVIKSKLS